MSGRFVRASSYRHVHGKAPKPEGEFTDLKPVCTGEGNYICANHKFFAYATVGGGGPVAIHRIDKPGRNPNNAPSLQVHKDQVLDFEFSPFIPTLIATAGEDLHVKVTNIPEQGLTANITSAAADLDGHERKVNTLHFHPTANNILASASSDLTIKIWDIEKQTNVLTYNDFGDVIHSFDFNPDGSMIVASGKDLLLRIYDPRNPKTVIKGNGFTGTKTSRALWRGDKGQIIALGSSKQSARQYGLWDIKMLNNPLTLVDIDTSAGVLLPHYDPDNGILYAAGKGDGNIRYWEIVDTDPYVHFLSEFRDNASQKGVAFLPKRAVDVKQAEIAVALRLMKDKAIPISFQVPRKSADTFQKDLYPDAYAGVPSLSADEWLAGRNAPPKKFSLNPATGGSSSSAASATAAPTSSFKAQKSPGDLQRDLDQANARIAELEALVARLQSK